MTTPLTRTRPATRIATACAALGLLAVLVLGASTGPAGAAAPSGSAPNYGHWDSDEVVAATSGAKVTGRVYWDSRYQGHYTITLTDTLNNGRAAVLQWRVKQKGKAVSGWAEVRTGTSWGPSTYNLAYFSGGWDYIEFRVSQVGASDLSWAYDKNVPGGD